MGPARLDSTVARSRLSLSEYSASGVRASWKRPCSRAVGLDQRDLLVAAAGQFQVAQALFVDGENAAGGAILGRHVRDGGAIGERQVLQAGAEILDKLADNAVLAQHLGDGEDQVGGGGALAQASGELHAHDQRDQHGDGLSQHGGLGFNAADAPAEHAQSVDHGGVRVGAHQRVGISRALATFFVYEDNARQVFQVDLVDDAGIGRHDGQIAESGLPPAQEGVAFFVALKFEQRIHIKGAGRAEFVHLHRVVNDQFGGLQRIDELRVAAQALHGVAHGGEIHDRGHAGEILQQDAAGREGNFFFRLGVLVPGRQRAHFFLGHIVSVFGAEQVFQKNAQRERQMLRRDALLVESIQAVDFVFLVADFESCASAEAVC